MKKTYIFIIIAVIVVTIGWLAILRTGQGPGTFSTSNTDTLTGQKTDLGKAPNFALQDYNGKTVSLADFTGKSLVINSWAAWCTFCKRELLDFAAVQKEFGDKIVIIAINRSESKETAKRYSDELEVTDDLVFLLDPKDSFYQFIGGFSMPETIFIDKEGNIVEHKRGIMDIQEIRQKIEKLISL